MKLSRIKNGLEAARWAENHPRLRALTYTGGHATAIGPTGECTFGIHRHEWPRFYRQRVINDLVAAGLGDH